MFIPALNQDKVNECTGVLSVPDKGGSEVWPTRESLRSIRLGVSQVRSTQTF